jgi:hypothetical protein
VVKKGATCVCLLQQTLHSDLSTVNSSPISQIQDNESPILTTVVKAASSKAAMTPLAEPAYTDSTELVSPTDVAYRDVTTLASSMDTI